MKFLIDENVSVDVAKYLEKEGHDIERVPRGAKNGIVIGIALHEKRILITSDVHFSNILLYPPNKYCGIIRLKIHPPSANKEIIAIKNLLSKFSSSLDFDKRLIVLEENDFRIRK